MLLRRLEGWLHQHIFKVGWLITHNFQTTTILYYTFFLPGVFIHELIYWLAAGILNIRADRAIKLPEAQEIGELKLNFIKLSPRADMYRKAIITAIPMLVGMLIIWFAAHNVFNLDVAAEMMSSGELTDIAAGLQQLTTAPDFWLWIYLVFTIANTMYPANPTDLKAWRNIGAILAVVAVIGFIIVPNGTLIENILTPLGVFFSEVQGVLLLIIGINIFMVLLLGFIEYMIEAVSGHSVTFRKGKMITMTRAEAQEARQQEREKAARKQARQRKASATTTLKTVYALEFPVPDVPGKEPVTQPDEAPRQPVLIAGGEVQDVAPLPEIPPATERREPVFNPASRKPESVPEAPVTDIEAEDPDIDTAVDDAIRIAQFQNQQRDAAPDIKDQPDINDDLSSIDRASLDKQTSARAASFRDKSPVTDRVDETIASAENDSEVAAIPIKSPSARKSVPLQSPVDDKDIEGDFEDIKNSPNISESVANITDNKEDVVDDTPDKPEIKPSPPPLPVEIPREINLSSLRDSLDAMTDEIEETGKNTQSTSEDKKSVVPSARISPFARKPDATVDKTEDDESEAEDLKPATPKGTLRQSPASSGTGSSLLHPRPFKPMSARPEADTSDKAEAENDNLSELFKSATPKGTLRRPAAGLRPFSMSASEDEDDIDDDEAQDTSAKPKGTLRTGLSSFKRDPAPDIFSRDSLRTSLSSDDEGEIEDDVLEYEDYDDVYYDDDDDDYSDYDYTDDDDISFYDDDD